MDGLFDVTEPIANPQLVIAAREAVGWTQAELAARMTALAHGGQPVSQGYVSRVEKGALDAAGTRLGLLAAALGVTEELLASDAKLWSLGDGCLYHRNRASTRKSTLRQLHARVNLMYVLLRRLAAVVGEPLPTFAFTPRPVGGSDSPREVAWAVREELGLGSGPIDSVAAVAESLGALVIRVPLGTREVDATSLHPPGEAPLMVVNSDAPTDRQRFTLAHEIGHTVCAPRPGVDAEEMAQQFAGELLAPGRQILPDLKAVPLTPARLLQLKAMWRMSATALMYRATDLGAITEARYRALSIETSALGWRSAEPEPLPAETPTVIPALLERVVHTAGSAEKAASCAGTTLESLYSMFRIDTAISPMKGE